MLIPEHICRKLHNRHQWLRWAWDGENENFAIVQLYHISDCGTYSNPQTYRAFWDVKTVEGEDGTARVVPDYKGPVFARDGSTVRDWDPLFRFPIHVITLDDSFKYEDGEKLHPIRDVYSGKVMNLINWWLRPQDKRIIESYKERQDRVVSKVEDIAGNASDRVWWDSQQTGYSARRDIAYKHAKPEIVAQKAKEERDVLKEYLKVPKMPSQELKRARH